MKEIEERYYRKGGELTNEEIEHYQKVVVAIKETIRIMKDRKAWRLVCEVGGETCLSLLFVKDVDTS